MVCQPSEVSVRTMPFFPPVCLSARPFKCQAASTQVGSSSGSPIQLHLRYSTRQGSRLESEAVKHRGPSPCTGRAVGPS